MIYWGSAARASLARIRLMLKSTEPVHLALDLATNEIVCADLTLDDVGDTSALIELLDQIDTSGASVAQFPASCFGHVLARRLRSLFHRQRTPPSARNLRMIQRTETSTLQKFKSRAELLGKPAAGIISAAELKRKSGAGRRLSGQS